MVLCAYCTHNGNYIWYKNHLLHRIGGPAVVWYNELHWFIDNKKVDVYYICG